jgi:GDP-4-dehydro-6-deoxy-D-mannose reductase
MHLFVTGIGGFVGTRLASHLRHSGHRVSGSYLEVRPRLDGADLYEADVLDRTALERAVRAADPEAIVHLAGLAHIGKSTNKEEMPRYFWVNYVGTENLLAVAGGRKVIFASSADVYGNVPADEQPIPESRPVAPRSPYGLTKAAAERLALAYGNAVIARSFNLVGPGQASGFMLPDFAAQIAAAREHPGAVIGVGNLSPHRDFLHVEDGAAAYRILAEKGEAGGVYNIASGRSTSVEEVLRRLMAVAGVTARVETDPKKYRPVDLPCLTGDASRLRALGWQPQLNLDRALTDLWRDFGF